MLNSISINKSNINTCKINNKSLTIPWPEPLTLREVVKKTHMAGTKTCHCRMWKSLFWMESLSSASMNARIDFINNLLVKIKQMNLPKTQPVTFISLGSAGLLMEFFIHQRMAAAGYEKLHWRFIDLDYKNDPIDDLMVDFPGTMPADKCYFPSDRDYFTRVITTDNLPIDDRSCGASIILAICPPTRLSEPSPSAAENIDPTGCLRMRGKTVGNSAEANSVYAMIAHPDDLKSILAGLTQGLDDVNFITWLSHVAKIYIDRHDEINIVYSDYFLGERLKNDISSCLQQAKNIAGQVNKLTGKNNDVFNIAHIDKAMRKFTENLEKRTGNQLSCATFIASDYDVGLQQLCDFFKDGQHPSLCAILENNETRFE
ncbi:hypothetical protein SJI19_03220 [Acerihabitans sp. TG2]|uniref:hypothetical protein n=1 Tax=Acerihabitans sp. TG2 TaxID=3096008 RepID=UPI002B22DC53|nr:hypothetical protein [Acerihabitans sp. TG2]MEA9389572.1 hypothetical protein [Acerihabitans sp. TG2]